MTPGTKVGPYEIISAIGAGGMGQVATRAICVDGTIETDTISAVREEGTEFGFCGGTNEQGAEL